MFGLSQIKLIIAAVFLVVILSLAGVAKYYHGQYVDAQVELGTTKQVLEATKKAAQDCSDNTQKLIDASQLKQDQVAEAQKQASILAQTNKAMASQILTRNTTNPNRCAAALDLINEYKTTTQRK